MIKQKKLVVRLAKRPYGVAAYIDGNYSKVRRLRLPEKKEIDTGLTTVARRIGGFKSKDSVQEWMKNHKWKYPIVKGYIK